VTTRLRLPGARLLAEQQPPAWIRDSPRAPWLVVATVCVGGLMGQLDASIVTLAFPALRHAFSAPLAEVQWAGQAYLLVLTGLLAPIGRFADMAGRKLLYSYGFVVFIVGSAMCGVAPSLPALLGARVCQGAGAAMLQANSVAIIAGAVPARRLGRAIGVQGAAQALGLALGPAVGGMLISLGGWRLVFLVNVPLGVAGAALSWLVIPRSRDLAPRRPFDWPGLGLFLPGVCALLLALAWGQGHGWGSVPVLASLAVSVLLLAGFAGRERAAAAPMIDPGLLRRAPVRAGLVTGLLAYLVLFGTLTVVPFYLEIAGRAPPARAGLQLLVVPLGLGLTTPLAGRLADRAGSRPLRAGGMAAVAVMLTASTLARGHSGLFLAALAAAGIGLGAFLPANNAAIMHAAPAGQAGMASGLVNMTRGLGTSFGLALAGLAYTTGAGPEPVTPAGSARGYAAAALLLALAAGSAAVVACRARYQPRHRRARSRAGLAVQ
jgi:EmrB/QacA subfamily drug resistance transporter